MTRLAPSSRLVRLSGAAALAAGIVAVGLALAGDSAGARKAVTVALLIGGAGLAFAAIRILPTLRNRNT